jgi:hypothetical protein
LGYFVLHERDGLRGVWDGFIAGIDRDMLELRSIRDQLIQKAKTYERRGNNVKYPEESFQLLTKARKLTWLL